jgi:hypothetical protein
MLNDMSPSTGEFVKLDNIYGQVMNLMIAGEFGPICRTVLDVKPHISPSGMRV